VNVSASPPLQVNVPAAFLPHYAQFQTLAALQRRNLYGGTVDPAEIADRRRRNRAARAARRINRRTR
jgi:hypothetical protein